MVRNLLLLAILRDLDVLLMTALAPFSYPALNKHLNPSVLDRVITPIAPMDAANADPLSTLETLENTAVTGMDDGLQSPMDQPVSTISKSYPVNTLDHYENGDAEYHDPLNTMDPYAKVPKPHQRFATADPDGPALDKIQGSPTLEDNNNAPNPSMDIPPRLYDDNAESGESPVPNYTAVHRKQPKSSEETPETDKRISRVAALLQESNTNQSNQGLPTLGYIEDGYTTISKYQNDREGDSSDQGSPEVINRQPDVVLREHKNPGSDSSGSTSRYSSCASGIEVSTSRQKLLRDDKVRFGTLDPRKLEDVTPSKLVNGRYVNPWDTWHNPDVVSGIKFMCMRSEGGIPSREILDQTLPVLTPDPSKIRDPPPSGINVTWIGHASLLVQFDGVSILTDPIFSSFCGPMSLMGYKRYRPVPCSVHMLPKVHAVVISHTHYDHLDLPTVQALNNLYGRELRWFVPLGVMDWFTQTGVENVIELDWWQENCIPSHSNVTFAFTPSQHWSQRTAFDRQKCLWGSWSIMGPNHSFFFAGDTGYCKAFKEIGQRYGPFDVAAIPIGAYVPRAFLSPQHVDPAQAVQIHLDVQAKQSVAIHWGTFQLGKEHYLAPPEDLKIAREKEGLMEEDFFTMKHGETRLLSAEDHDNF